MKLGDISEITPGYAFRGAVVPDKDGNLRVFQAKDLVRGVFVTDTTELTPVSLDLPAHTGYLMKNDVLLIARGMKAGSFRSTVFKSDESNVIASASVHIIRVTEPSVLPEYVCYYLNSKTGQDDLSEIVTGSYIGALPRRELLNIKIPTPELNKQQVIVDLYQNIKEQQRILKRNSELKQRVIEATFTNLNNHYE